MEQHDASRDPHDLSRLDLSRIAQDLQIRKLQVESVVQLLDEGNTVPFITRYRKERTGGLDEEVIRIIQARVTQLRQLAERKQTILKTIENQGKLTDELKAAILGAETSKRLEDLYLPYKPKKRTLATVARERGLEPAAVAVWTRDPAVGGFDELLASLVNPEKELNTVEEVRAGIGHILAETIAETADLRAAVRALVWDTATLTTAKSEKLQEGQGLDYKDYFEFTEPVRHIPPHRVLAINRGEKESALTVKMELDPAAVRRVAHEKLPLADHPQAEFLETVLEDALTRLLLPSLEREIRRELTTMAEDHAVEVFARNLKALLLAAPLRGRRVLAIDPGFRTGCKVAALDEFGNLLAETVVYPHASHPPRPRKEEKPKDGEAKSAPPPSPARLGKRIEALNRLEDLIRRHQTQVIAIGNGTACRETEELIAELITDLEERRAAGTLDVPRPMPTPPPPPPKPAPAVPPSAEVVAPPGVSTSAETPHVEMPAEVSEAPTAPPELTSVESSPVESVPGVEHTTEHTTEHLADSALPAPPTEAPPEVHHPEPAAETPPEVHVPEPTAEAHVAESVPEPAPEPAPPAEPLPHPPADLAYVIVNEAGASVYSASVVGREEFPDFDATLRGTISIGRRLQDPLSELVKIDPQSIGVGLYQHDVNPKHLKESLDVVIESCVNHVGVDLNTASVPLLRHVSGLNQLAARELVEFRKQHGPFRSREQLQQVPGIGPARYVQAAGFLKLGEPEDPLDQTWIHPESYPAARQLLADLGYGPDVLRDRERLPELAEKLKEVNVEETAQRLDVGAPTLADILAALGRPGRDPREDLPPPIFKKGILKLEDLQPNMELKGTVLNVVDFGAFVDIGLKDSGLVHISQMANRFIKSPYDVVSVGDVVDVWVLSVDTSRRRVSLTMIKPGTERKPPERRPAGERGPRPQGQGQQHDRGPRPQGQQHDRGPRPQGQDRGPRPPRGPRPQPQHGRRPQGAPPGGQEATGQGTREALPPRTLPPRKPRRATPKPKLSQDALQGKAPLRTFGELDAFFTAKQQPADAPTPPAAPPPPPSAEVVAPPTPPPAPPAAPENENPAPSS